MPLRTLEVIAASAGGSSALVARIYLEVAVLISTPRTLNRYQNAKKTFPIKRRTSKRPKTKKEKKKGRSDSGRIR